MDKNFTANYLYKKFPDYTKEVWKNYIAKSISFTRYKKLLIECPMNINVPFGPSSSVQQNSPPPSQNSSPEFRNSPFGFNFKATILQFRGAILQSRGAILQGGYFAAQNLTVQTVYSLLRMLTYV